MDFQERPQPTRMGKQQQQQKPYLSVVFGTFLGEGFWETKGKSFPIMFFCFVFPFSFFPLLPNVFLYLFFPSITSKLKNKGKTMKQNIKQQTLKMDVNHKAKTPQGGRSSATEPFLNFCFVLFWGRGLCVRWVSKRTQPKQKKGKQNKPRSQCFLKPFVVF